MPRERNLHDIALQRRGLTGSDDEVLSERHKLAKKAAGLRARNLDELRILVDLLVEYVRPDDEPTLVGPLTSAIDESITAMLGDGED